MILIWKALETCSAEVFSSRVSSARRREKMQSVASRVRRRTNHELNFPPNFERLVLGCIDADFCKQISLESSWYYKIYIFFTAQILRFQPNIVNIFWRMNKWISDFSFLVLNLQFFWEFFMKFCPNFATNSRKSDVCRSFNRICENKIETCRKFWNLWK